MADERERAEARLLAGVGLMAVAVASLVPGGWGRGAWLFAGPAWLAGVLLCRGAVARLREANPLGPRRSWVALHGPELAVLVVVFGTSLFFALLPHDDQEALRIQAQEMLETLHLVELPWRMAVPWHH